MDAHFDDHLEDALSEHRAVENLAQSLQTLIKSGEAVLPPVLVSALHGEPLGHPLHPILVHLPLGGWMIAGWLDFAPKPKNADPEGAARAADLALTLGTLGAVGTLASGWTDWSNTRAQARRTGVIHGLLNETAFILSGTSILLRRRGHRRLGKALSGTGLVLALAGGFLGGQLVYRHGLGVYHTMTRPQS